MNKVKKKEDDLRSEAIKRYLEGEPCQQIANEYGMTYWKVFHWIRHAKAIRKPRKQQKNEDCRSTSMNDQSKETRTNSDSDKQIQSMAQEIARLKAALQQSDKKLAETNLKLRSREVMIDLAEEHYNIKIRKKSGAKQ